MITLEGFVGKVRYSNGDYKIYPFYPLAKYQDLVIMDKKYKNISISGEMPDMYENVEYKIDVEYVKNGKYDNYVFKRVYNTQRDFNGDITRKFLESVLTHKQSEEILKHYPNIIDLVLKDKPVDVSILYGIKEKTMNVIKRKIVENFKLIELVDEYKEYGMTFTMMKNLYDAYPSIEVIKKKMEEDPYTCLCRLNRVGFKTADDFIMKKFPNKINSKMRAEACIDYILSENENSGNSWIYIAELYKQFKNLTPEANMHFKDVLGESENIYYDEETKRISLRNTYLCEKEIRNKIDKFLSKNTILNIDYKQYNEVDGIPLSEEQMKIHENVCKYNINILTGFGGTGKSFSAKALIDMLEDNMITYTLMAPTGKASKVLSEYTGKEATTIHRGLRYNPRTGFYYNQNTKLPFDVVIVDEYSMIDIFLLRDLFRAIDENSKIIFIGDPAQIPSVGVGNIAFDMLESKQIPVALLTKVFRYGEGGLSYVATKIREGENYVNSNSLQTFGAKKDYTFVNTNQENSINCMITLYKNLLTKGYSVDDILVLSAYNKGNYGTIKINNIIQDMVNPWDGKSQQTTSHRIIEDITFRINDRVMQCRNNYKALTTDLEETSVFNGDVGVIKDIKGDGDVIVDIDGTLIVYEKSQLDQLNLAYALSIHKSQGSNSKAVIMITPSAHKFFLDRNLMYVGASRAKEVLYHIGSIDVITSALRKSQNYNRNTWLLEMLQKSA